MTTYQGVLSGVASTTVAATTIRTQMQTTIPANTAWTLVESTTMNAGAVPCDVYKCAAAGSGRSADFFVAVMQNAGSLYLGIAEGYNVTTHKPKRPALLGSAVFQTLQADGGLTPATTEIDWYNGTFNPGGGVLSIATPSVTCAVSATDDYLIVVAKDCLVLTVRTAGKALTAGAYDSLVPTPATNDPLPLILASTNISVGQFALRQPLCGGLSISYATLVTGQSNAQNLGGNGVQPLNGYNLGAVGGAVADNFDRYVGGPTADKYPLLNAFAPGSATAGRNINGWVRGTYRLLRSLMGVAGTVWGDTATIDGVTYLCVIASTSQANTVWVEVNPL